MGRIQLTGRPDLLSSNTEQGRSSEGEWQYLVMELRAWDLAPGLTKAGPRSAQKKSRPHYLAPRIRTPAAFQGAVLAAWPMGNVEHCHKSKSGAGR